MKIYIICPVRIATPDIKGRLEAYTDWLEDKGHEVHLPHRDTDQGASEFTICKQNGTAIALAEEVHILYDKASTGSHFDLGIVFAYDALLGYKKRIRTINFPEYTDSPTSGKSFMKMMQDWEVEQNHESELYPQQAEGMELDFTIPFETF